MPERVTIAQAERLARRHAMYILRHPEGRRWSVWDNDGRCRGEWSRLPDVHAYLLGIEEADQS